MTPNGPHNGQKYGAKFWRRGVDEKRVAKAVETTEKASREHDLAKQP